jgi:hypothetical protein
VIESTPSSALTDHGDGTVTHALFGLMWKQCAEGLSGAGCATGTATSMSWMAALTAAVADNTAGYDDWRLPNNKELQTIVELCGHNPSINLSVFPAAPASRFWTSSTYVGAPNSAWIVGFDNGDDYVSQKSNGFYVRLVRGGQSFESFDATDPTVVVFTDGFE